MPLSALSEGLSRTYADVNERFYDDDPLFITNFSREDEERHIQAIELSGADLEISDIAVSTRGRRIHDLKALRFREKREDLSEFWHIYRQLLKQGQSTQ